MIKWGNDAGGTDRDPERLNHLPVVVRLSWQISRQDSALLIPRPVPFASYNAASLTWEPWENHSYFLHPGVYTFPSTSVTSCRCTYEYDEQSRGGITGAQFRELPRMRERERTGDYGAVWVHLIWIWSESLRSHT